MATVSVFVKGGSFDEGNEITVTVDVVAIDDLGNAFSILDTGIDIVPSGSAPSITNVIQNEARQMAINAGGPTIPTNQVKVFGGPQT